MARRVRLTIFSRLLLVLLVLIPAAYFGASYFRGEDPIANIKSWMGKEEVVKVEEDSPSTSAPAKSGPQSEVPTEPDVQDLQDRILQLEAENEKLRKEIKRLQDTDRVGFE